MNLKVLLLYVVHWQNHRPGMVDLNVPVSVKVRR